MPTDLVGWQGHNGRCSPEAYSSINITTGKYLYVQSNYPHMCVKVAYFLYMMRSSLIVGFVIAWAQQAVIAMPNLNKVITV